MCLTKKLCAIALSLVLLISCMSVFTVSAATDVTITFTGFNSGGETDAGADSGDWRFFIKTDVAMTNFDKEYSGYTVSWSNGSDSGTGSALIYPQSAGSGMVAWVRFFDAPSTAALVNGATMTLHAGAGTYAATGDTITVAEPLRLMWNADISQWDICPHTMGENPVVIPYFDVYDSTSTSFNIHIPSTLSAFTVATENWSDRFLPADDIVSGFFYTSGGTTTRYVMEAPRGMPCIGNGRVFYMADFPNTPVTGDTITLKGDFYSTLHDEEFTIPYPIVFTYNGSTWSRTSEEPDMTVYDSLAFNGFASDATKPGGTYWDFYLKVDGTIPGAVNGSFANTLQLSVKNSSGTTILDHANSTELVYQAHGGGTLLFRVLLTSLPLASVDAGSLFTFHAGKAKSNTDGVNGIEITEDYKLEYNGSTFDAYIEYTTYTGKLQTPTGGNATALYCGSTDSLHTVFTDDGWTDRLAPASDGVSGIYVDGVKQEVVGQNNGLLLHLSANSWYLDWQTAASAGSILTVKGTFVSAEHAEKVVIEECKFIYDGSSWSDYVEDTTTYNDMTVSGVYNFGTENGDWRFNLTVDGTWPTAGDFEAYDNLVIYINETQLADGVINVYKNGDYLMLCLWGALTSGIAPVNGDTVTIKAGKSKATSDTTVGINLTEDIVLTYDGTNWNLPDTTTYTDMTVTGIDANTNLNVYLYLTTSAAMPGEAWGSIDEVPVKWDQKITINGTEYTVSAKKWTENGLFIEFPAAYLTKPGDIITVKAGKYKSNVGSLGYNLTADYALTYTGTGFIAGEIATTELTFDRFVVSTQKADTKWQFYLHTTASVPGSAWGGVFSQVITVDGVETTLDDVKSAGGTTWYAGVPYSALPTTGEHTLVFKSGWYKSGTEAVAYYLPADVTVYVNKYGASFSGFITPNATVPKLFFESSDGVNGLYVTTAENDGAQYAGDWSLSTYANNFSSPDLLNFYYGDNGFYINGAQHTGDNKYTGMMKKLGEKKYYVCLADQGINSLVTEGTTLVIQGLFHDANGYLVEFEATEFVYEDGAWKQAIDRSGYTEYTGKFFIGTTSSNGGDGAQIVTKEAGELYLKGSDSLAALMNGMMIEADHIQTEANPVIDDGNIWNVALMTAMDGAGNGVFLNGAKITTGFQKYHYLNNWWYMSGITATTAGDTLVIKGQFYNDAAQVIVNVTESTFEWDGSKWVDVLTSAVKYDVNADGLATVLDAALLKRYLTDNTIAVSNMADINGDSVVDAQDLRILRRYILGIEITVVDGVAQGTPYYAGGEMQKVAYVAPAIGSFDAESEVVTFLSDDEIDRVLDEYAAVGFTHIVTENVATLYDNTADYAGQQLLYRYYEESAERGMKVIIISEYLNYLLNYEGDLADITYPNGNTWEDILDDIVVKQQKYEAFAGFMVGDEPTDAKTARYLELLAYMRANHPSVLMWYACFPNYVSSTGVADYESYVATFGNANGHFMYDNYGLRTKTSWTGSSTDYYIEDTWFTNLQTVATVAKNNGFTVGVTMQSVALQQTGGGWFQNAYQTRPIKAQADIGFQVYTALAYGMKELDFFTYGDHWNTEMVDGTAMRNDDGTLNDSYYYTQSVYANIANLEAALLNFSWLGTLDYNLKTLNDEAISTGSTYAVSDNSRLNAVNVSGSAVIGCMKDTQDGFDGYMIANASEPYNGSSATVTITFNNATRAMVYAADGSVSIISLTGGQYSVTVPKGEGVFVIPLV